jgi:hypothetical protein
MLGPMIVDPGIPVSQNRTIHRTCLAHYGAAHTLNANDLRNASLNLSTALRELASWTL